LSIHSTQTSQPRATRLAHFSRSRISRHPLHFNDADEVSCRAGAIKCSRCRASFAPISSALAEQKLVPPAEPALADPLSETKNWWKFLPGKSARQVRRGLLNEPGTTADDAWESA